MFLHDYGLEGCLGSRLQQLASPGREMTFAILSLQRAQELGLDGTQTLAAHWKNKMEIGGLNAQVYATDPGCLDKKSFRNTCPRP